MDGELPSAAPGLRVGADLREARERLGWTLPAIAAHLRIRLPYLEAIEQGHIEKLPGNAYAVGFLRTYAHALGLDPEEIARRFRAEAGEVNRKTELAFPAPVPDRGVPAGALVLVGAVVAVLAYAGWYHVSGEQRPAAQVVQEVPERLAPLAGKPAAPAPAAIATPAPSPAESSPAPAPPAQLADSTPAAAPAPALPSVSPSSAAAAMTPPLSPAPTAPVAASVPAGAPAAAQPQVGAAPPTPGIDPNAGRILLRAKADSWIQVRERQGKVLLNRVLRNGETWQVPQRPQPLLLTTGNAGGTELLVDGVAAASLGADGAVRRDLPLDPDAIKDGKLGPAARGQRS